MYIYQTNTQVKLVLIIRYLQRIELRINKIHKKDIHSLCITM